MSIGFDRPAVAGVRLAGARCSSVSINGDPRIVTESDLAAHTSDPDALHHTPPAGGGEGCRA